MLQNTVRIAFCFTLTVLTSCSTDRSSEPDSSALEIVIVGEGLKNNCTDVQASREGPINRAQGMAMWHGAEAAYNTSSLFSDLKAQIHLRSCEDMGKASVAKGIAHTLRADPHVLAVIGHASSGTTHEAAPEYAGAGIPLLMPIATSPTVCTSRLSGARLSNCWRLPPSDVLGQAPALAITARDVLEAKRIYFIRDTTGDAGEYSGPLYSKVISLLNDYKVDERVIDRRQASLMNLVRSVRSHNPDLVIFVGYATTAEEIISMLRDEYSQAPNVPKPRLLLTDGSKTNDLDTRGFDTYVSFPSPNIFAAACDDQSGAAALRSIIKSQNSQSYEMYAFDAMLILGHAIHNCQGRVSRSCINHELDGGTLFSGVCSQYQFAQGENKLSGYYVYHTPASGKLTPQPLFISDKQIARFMEEGEGGRK
jgi:ABC-type branched-subunit amino acid transport system substrate-binding protein